MDQEIQATLLEMPEQPAGERCVGGSGRAKLRKVQREQTMLVQICVDELIGQDHKARGIWELSGRLDLKRFEEPLKTRAGAAGRAAWDPRLLVSIWVYAYSEGIGSAREVERLMEWEPGLQWLGGLKTVNHHTLSDFRVAHRKALDDLFAQILGMLEAQGLLSLERVMQDGTKIRAHAGIDTFRREKSLREHVERARQVVAAMGDPQAETGERDRRQAARERAARERCERLDQAMKEWESLSARLPSEEEKKDLRVSLTEPEARRMKHGDNAIAPSYNAQITTEANHKLIVSAYLSQAAGDAHELLPAMERVNKNLRQMPAQVVADGGYTNRDNIVACAAKNIDLVGSLPDPAERSEAAMKSMGIDPAFAPHHFKILEAGKRLECPGGCVLEAVRQSRKRGDRYQQYQARSEDCQACEHRPRCCPGKPPRGRTVSLRVEEQAEVAAFRRKMAQPESQAIYRQRGPVAEFPHAWIKEKLGLRKFRVRGLAKAGSELLWACLTYNIMQWMRLTAGQPATT